jgi:hypothetical protein
LIDCVGVSDGVDSLDDDGVERRLFLIKEVGKFLIPVFEADLGGVEIEVLNVVIIGVYNLFE